MAMVPRVFSGVAGTMMILLALIFGDVLCKEVYSSNRSTFPGRRVGGGTRGECNARILVHLVPENSVFAPGATGILGLVQGPTANPVSLELSFLPEGVGSATTRTLRAASANLTLISGAAIAVPTIWESTFNCETGNGVDSVQDPLAFTQPAFPPVLSLLLPDVEPVDHPVQKALTSLRAKCGGNVPATQTLAQFGLGDLVTEEWPEQLPVRCPF
ncbi:hypothetical protein [Synechococcus sp. RS9902]|uniref:hypothetical protein n=1 Tax=Synechococcus sp. RS9902 TaxID=221345 RepID=UPI001CA419FC|nr:hypothetical protein [Synechococcus sp. RS9902]